MQHILEPIVSNSYANLSLDSKLKSIRNQINEYLLDSLNIDIKLLRHSLMEKFSKSDVFLNGSDREHVKEVYHRLNRRS